MSLMRPKQKKPGAAEFWQEYRAGRITRAACHDGARDRSIALDRKLDGVDPESVRYETLRREQRRYDRIAGYTRR